MKGRVVAFRSQEDVLSRTSVFGIADQHCAGPCLKHEDWGGKGWSETDLDSSIVQLVLANLHFGEVTNVWEAFPFPLPLKIDFLLILVFSEMPVAIAYLWTDQQENL